MGLPEPVIATYLDHRPPTTIAPVDAHVAALQQQTADLFYQNRTVPKQVNIRERIWQPAGIEGKNHESESFLVLPTHGDGHYLGTEEGARPVDHGYLQQIARAADRIGFTGVLIPTGRSCEDAWLVAASMIPVTQRLKFLGSLAPKRGVAHRRGTPGGNAGQALQRPRAVQPGDGQRSAGAGGRWRFSRSYRAL